jgi:hypothetical protein
LLGKCRFNPNAGHALLVVTRISQPMREFTFLDRCGKTIPAPNVRQGISLFPKETDDIFKLIDLADQRLYMVNNHRCDQIEDVAIESLP